MKRGGLILLASGAHPPPPALGHAMGKAPPTTKTNPRPRRPAHPIGRVTQNRRLLLLLLLLLVPLSPPNPAATCSQGVRS